MSEARVRLRDRKIVILFQVVFAALCFMAITQLTHVAVTRGLMLVGLRADVPMVISVGGCGKTIETALVDRIDRTESRHDGDPLCPDAAGLSFADVTATAPSGQLVDLIVNHQKVQKAVGVGGKVEFRNVGLRRGRNTLAVAAGKRAGDYLSFQEAGNWDTPTLFGRVPLVSGSAPIEIAVGESKSADLMIIGGWKSGQGYDLLISGNSNSPAALESVGRDIQVSIGRSGFGVASVDALPPNVPLLTDQTFQRHFIVTRDDSGGIAVDIDVRLPLKSRQAEWMSEHAISALEFANLNGVELSPDSIAESVTWTVSNVVEGDVMKITGKISTSGMAVSFFSEARSPFDSAVFRGFDTRLQYFRDGVLEQAQDVVTISGSDSETTYVQKNYSDALDRLDESVMSPRQDDQDTPSTIAGRWKKVESSIPFWLRALLSGTAGLAPILLVVVSIRKAEQIGKTEFQSTKDALPSLLCLLLLGAAIIAQPIFLQMYGAAAGAVSIGQLTSDFRGDGSSTFSDPYASTALAISLMLVPFLRSLTLTEGRRPAMGSIFAPIFCLLGVALLVSLLLLQLRPWSTSVDGGIYGWLDTAGMPLPSVPMSTCSALTIGLLCAWIPLCWSFNLLSPAGGFFWASLVAGAATILLPLVTAAIDALRIFMSAKDSFTEFGPALPSVLASAVLPFFLFLVLLTAFRDIGILVLPQGWQQRANHYGKRRWILLTAGLLTLPLLDFSKTPNSGESSVLQVLGTFQSFSLVIASAAVVCGLMRSPSDETQQDDIAKFRFGPREILLLTALYAGYLSLWTHQTLPTLAAIFFGWLIFRYIIIDDGSLLPPELATPQTAVKLIEIQQESALLKARRKTLEDKFTKGETSYLSLTAARNGLDKIQKLHENSLRFSLKEAKRRLLEFGPGSSPLRNGLRGAVAGIAFGTFLQLATSIRVPELAGPLREWVAFAHTALVDPGYSITQEAGSMRIFSSSDATETISPDLLLFIGAVVNAYFLWSLLGFLFGFVFHRIRGDDGVVKALVFSAGVTATYAISQLFSTSSEGINLIRMLPVMVFLLVTGIAVFDARSLATRGVSPARLADVYGFRTSVGYASVLGAIVAVQPVISFIRDAMGGK